MPLEHSSTASHNEFSTTHTFTEASSRAYWADTPSAEHNVHFSSEAAQKAGLPELLVSAPHLLAVIDHLVGAFVGAAAWTESGSINLKFLGMALAGDTVVVSGKVLDDPTLTAGTRNITVRVTRSDLPEQVICVGTAQFSALTQESSRGVDR